MFRVETKNDWAKSILFGPRINYLIWDWYDQIELQAVGKNVHPDTFTGIRDEPQRVIGDLNEAMRILAKAHARPFLEPKSLSPFHNFEEFKNAEFNSKTQKIKKKLMIQKMKLIMLCVLTFIKIIKKQKKHLRFSDFNTELTQLKAS